MPRDLTRREVLHYGVATGLAATRGGHDVQAQTATNIPADLIIYNGRLATMDGRQTFAAAAAITDGRFVAVGGEADAVIDIVKQHAGAYGAGVEYAYTMVHGQAPDGVPTATHAAIPGAR